jgi:HAT1-interacting factor 1
VAYTVAHRTAKYGDKSLESADLLLVYGKSLLENAVSQSAVLSKEEEEKKAAEEEGAHTVLCWLMTPADICPKLGAAEPQDPRFIFEGDAPIDDEEAVELSNLPDDEEPEEQEEQEEDEEGGEDEPEDDFNAAWEVFELARMLYDQHKDDDDEIKLKLADTYLALGDVSLETGMHRLTFHIVYSTKLCVRKV